MVFFAGGRPGGRGGSGGGMGASAGVRPPQPQGPRISALHGLNVSQPNDATPGTFYSAMSNVDIEIGDGNPGAAGVRARYAQHCYLAHMEFRTGSGFAGVRDGGNYAEDVRFVGGKWGVMTRKPSPGWQFTLVDAEFEGQREGAIKTHEAGMTLIHPRFRNVPTAVSIDPDYAEELWIKGRPHGERRRPGHRDQPRAESEDRDQRGERVVPQREGVRVVPGERQDGGRRGRELRGEDVQPRPALRGYGRHGRDQNVNRRGEGVLLAGGQTGPAGTAGARQLDQRPDVRRQGRRRQR